MFKGEKGITLIALAITIIVLLILAGITITALNGQNSVLTQADNARSSYSIEASKESVRLDNFASSLSSLSREYSK